MSSTDVRVVRVYIDESEHKLKLLLSLLHDDLEVRGVTVFRGIVGFGPSGKMHGGGIVDLAMDLPLVIEFFDTPDKASVAMERLQQHVKPAHMISWQAATDMEG